MIQHVSTFQFKRKARSPRDITMRICNRKRCCKQKRVHRIQSLFVERLLIIRRITRCVPVRATNVEQSNDNRFGERTFLPISLASSTNQDLFTRVDDISAHCTRSMLVQHRWHSEHTGKTVHAFRSDIRIRLSIDTSCISKDCLDSLAQ